MVVLKAVKGRGSPGHAAVKDRGSPGHAAVKDRGSPGHAAVNDRGSPGHAAFKDQGSPGHAAVNDRGSPGHAAVRDRGSPGHAAPPFRLLRCSSASTGREIGPTEDLGRTECIPHMFYLKEGEGDPNMIQAAHTQDSPGKQGPSPVTTIEVNISTCNSWLRDIDEVNISTCNSWLRDIDKVNISTCNSWLRDMDEDILGSGPDSKYATPPGHLEEYVYKNFQRTPFIFIFSWRKRLFEEMHILPPPRMQISGDCAYNSTVTLMECHLKVMFAGRPAGMSRVFNVRLSAEHLKRLVAHHYGSKAGKKLKHKDKLITCLAMARKHGVVSEEDYAAGCPPEAIRYKIKSFRRLRDREKLDIPARLEKAEMVLTTFRVTDTYRLILPHEIYRYEAPEQHPGIHPAHCVVLTCSGLVYNDLEAGTDDEKVNDPEVAYEYLNSYNGWGIDGSGYIYADSIRESYIIKVAEPTHM